MEVTLVVGDHVSIKPSNEQSCRYAEVIMILDMHVGLFPWRMMWNIAEVEPALFFI
jgi:hypothetical protein